MKVYLAISPGRPHIKAVKAVGVKNVLVSFHASKDFFKFLNYSDFWEPENLIIDSGAFSVWTLGEYIDIDKYIRYCKDIFTLLTKNKSLHFVNLDVLPGKFGIRPTKEEAWESAKQGWANMEYMENEGLKVIPVFHQHEDFEWLEKMMKHTNYVGISPANDVSQQSKNNWLRKVFNITQDKVKTHGFAVTALKTILEFPFYSVDSSSWVTGARYGRVPTFFQGRYSSYGYKSIEDLSKLWHRIPNDKKLVDLASSESIGHSKRMEIGAEAFMKMEEFVNLIWRNRGIKW